MIQFMVLITRNLLEHGRKTASCTIQCIGTILQFGHLVNIGLVFIHPTLFNVLSVIKHHRKVVISLRALDLLQCSL